MKHLFAQVGGTDAQVVLAMVGIKTILMLVIEMRLIQKMNATNTDARYKDNVKNATDRAGFSVRLMQNSPAAGGFFSCGDLKLWP